MSIPLSKTIEKIHGTLLKLSKEKGTGHITVVHEIDISQGTICKATIDVKTDLMAEK